MEHRVNLKTAFNLKLNKGLDNAKKGVVIEPKHEESAAENSIEDHAAEDLIEDHVAENSIENHAPEIEVVFRLPNEELLYFEMNQQKLSETYNVLLNIDNEKITVKGTEDAVHRFFDFKKTLVTASIPEDGLNASTEFVNDKADEILNVSTHLDEENQVINFYGPLEDVKEAVANFEKYIVETRVLDVVETKIDEKLQYIEHMLLEKKAFYECVTGGLKKFIGESFVEAVVVKIELL